jgi:hypothetical protein
MTVARIDVSKLYRDAASTPSGYPPFGRVDPEAFRRRPIAGGEAAYGVNYDKSARPVPVSSATLSAAAIARPGK